MVCAFQPFSVLIQPNQGRKKDFCLKYRVHSETHLSCRYIQKLMNIAFCISLLHSLFTIVLAHICSYYKVTCISTYLLERYDTLPTKCPVTFSCRLSNLHDSGLILLAEAMHLLSSLRRLPSRHCLLLQRRDSLLVVFFFFYIHACSARVTHLNTHDPITPD